MERRFDVWIYEKNGKRQYLKCNKCGTIKVNPDTCSCINGHDSWDEITFEEAKQLMETHERVEFECYRCGCVEEDACPEGCFWVLPWLCSSCCTLEEMNTPTDELFRNLKDSKPLKPSKPLVVDAGFMRTIGDGLHKTIGKKCGFILTVIEWDNPKQGNYYSNIHREDMIKALREMADEIEQGKDFLTPESN